MQELERRQHNPKTVDITGYFFILLLRFIILMCKQTYVRRRKIIFVESFTIEFVIFVEFPPRSILSGLI